MKFNLENKITTRKRRPMSVGNVYLNKNGRYMVVLVFCKRYIHTVTLDDDGLPLRTSQAIAPVSDSWIYVGRAKIPEIEIEFEVDGNGRYLGDGR